MLLSPLCYLYVVYWGIKTLILDTQTRNFNKQKIKINYEICQYK